MPSCENGYGLINYYCVYLLVFMPLIGSTDFRAAINFVATLTSVRVSNLNLVNTIKNIL